MTNVNGWLFGLPTDLKPEESAGCERFNEEVNTFIAQTASVRTVIIGRLWGGGDGFDRTVNLVKQLVKTGKTVILLGPLPEPKFNVPERWAQQQSRAGHAIESMSIQRTSHGPPFDLRGRLRTELSEQLASGKIVLIDPLQRFCNETECLLVDRGVSYFRDNSHVSEAGAVLFTPDFAKALLSRVRNQ